jgi:anthranilate synthase component 2
MTSRLMPPLPTPPLRSPFQACRYHSLVIKRDTIPEELEITAWTEDGTIMGVRHKK